MQSGCDFYELIRKGVAKSALEKLELLARVVEHKSLFFRSAGAKYGEAVRATLRIAPAEHRLKPLRDDYSKMQQMSFGQTLEFDNIVALLTQWESELHRTWSAVAADCWTLIWMGYSPTSTGRSRRE